MIRCTGTLHQRRLTGRYESKLGWRKSSRRRASELLAVLDCLIQQADLEPTYRLQASTLAVAIHRLALQEQTWLDQQSTGAGAGAKGT